MTHRRTLANGRSERERRARGGKDGPRPFLHSVDDIVDMMRLRIRDLVNEWKLRGHEDGHDFVAFNPLRVDASLGSFKVALDGPFKGLVKDFAGGPPRSPLGFTADLFFAGDNVKAIKWARAWLGLDGTDPHSFEKTQAAIARKERPRDFDKEARDKRNSAYAMFLAASTELAGSPVDLYLKGRGVDISRLPFGIRCVRYHPHLNNGESDRPWPAMVAPICDSQGNFLAAHRTWLEVQTDGSVKKAPLSDPKLTLGRYRGGLIRLWNGIRVDVETGEIRPGRKLREEKGGAWIDLTEGIEDGLSVALAYNERRVAAGVSVGNMIHLQLPDVVSGVRFWKQNDKPGSPADRDFKSVIENQQAQGKQVRILVPPQGVKDVNDVLRGENNGK